MEQLPKCHITNPDSARAIIEDVLNALYEADLNDLRQEFAANTIWMRDDDVGYAVDALELANAYVEVILP